MRRDFSYELHGEAIAIIVFSACAEMFLRPDRQLILVEGLLCMRRDVSEFII